MCGPPHLAPGSQAVYGFGGLPEMTTRVDELFDGSGSNVVLDTLAVLLIWPVLPFGMIAIVMARLASGASVPRLQVATAPASVQLGSSTATRS